MERLINLTDLHRFFGKIEVVPETGCWLWQGHRDQKGYGQFKFRGKAVWAHRFIFEVFIRILEDEETVHHICHNPPCVNPLHMEAVTRSMNSIERNHRGRIRRMLSMGQTLFPLGEILDDEPPAPF